MKDEIFNIVSVGQRKKSESPAGIEPMTSQTPGGALSTELRELIIQDGLYTADPSSMQNMCQLVIKSGLAHHEFLWLSG